MPKVSRTWVTVAGIVLTIACVAFFALQAATLISEDDFDFRRSFHLLPIALPAFLAAYAAFAFGWHFLLLATGVRPSLSTSVGIFSTTQFAKYFPGNIGHHISRAALAASLGIPIHAVLATMVAEIVIVMAWMLALGLPLLDFWTVRLGLDGAWMLLAGVISAGTAILAVSLLYLFRKRPRAASAVASLRQMATHARRSPGNAGLATLLLLAGILATALALALLDPTKTLPSLAHFPVVAGLFAAAWLLGFVTPGAPAGIGIREVILTEGLTPLVGREQSIVIALMFRVLSTTADLLVFLAGLGILWRQRMRVG